MTEHTRHDAMQVDKPGHTPDSPVPGLHDADADLDHLCWTSQQSSGPVSGGFEHVTIWHNWSQHNHGLGFCYGHVMWTGESWFASCHSAACSALETYQVQRASTARKMSLV